MARNTHSRVHSPKIYQDIGTTMSGNEIITTDLANFDQEALHTGAELLTQLARSNLEFDSPLHLKTNTATHETFLGNTDIALGVGDNGYLHELEMDDYAREFKADTELKYGKDSAKFHDASLLHRELVEYENVIEDYRETAIKSAVDKLDPVMQTIVHTLDELLEQDIDPHMINADEMQSLSDAFNSLRATVGADTYGTQIRIQQTFHDLRQNLEN